MIHRQNFTTKVLNLIPHLGASSSSNGPLAAWMFFTLRARLCVYFHGEGHYNAAVKNASVGYYERNGGAEKIKAGMIRV